MVADRAVEEWLEQEQPDIFALSALPTEQLCRELPALLGSPPPEPGTRVNLDDRRELDSDSETSRLYSYSAVRPGDRLEVVQVRVEEQEGQWVATDVRFRQAAGGRDWLQTPTAGWAFTGFTLLVIYLLATESFLRRWVRRGLQVVRENRGVVIFTMLLLYGIFAAGVATGGNLPDECTEAALAIVEDAVTMVGATEAYGSGNVARAAAVTFYQNFGVVTLSVTFALALLFGIPAYLLSGFSFFVQAIPFGMVGAFSSPSALFVIILILLELTAYFLVVSGGGILLRTIVRNGFAGFPKAVRSLALMLPLAMLLLLVGAWYEAAILIL